MKVSNLKARYEDLAIAICLSLLAVLWLSSEALAQSTNSRIENASRRGLVGAGDGTPPNSTVFICGYLATYYAYPVDSEDPDSSNPPLPSGFVDDYSIENVSIGSPNCRTINLPDEFMRRIIWNLVRTKAENGSLQPGSTYEFCDPKAGEVDAEALQLGSQVLINITYKRKRFNCV